MNFSVIGLFPFPVTVSQVSRAGSSEDGHAVLDDDVFKLLQLTRLGFWFTADR